MIMTHRIQNLLSASRAHRASRARLLVVATTLVLAAGVRAGSGKTPAAGPGSLQHPEEAAEALIVAADTYDVEALTRILGPDGVDLVDTGDPVQDRNQSLAFATVAREKTQVVREPDDPKVAVLWVGVEDWPVPMPIVEGDGRWFFDTEAGREELTLPPHREQRVRCHRRLPRLCRGAARVRPGQARRRPGEPVCTARPQHPRQTGWIGVAGPRRDLAGAGGRGDRPGHRRGLRRKGSPTTATTSRFSRARARTRRWARWTLSSRAP